MPARLSIMGLLAWDETLLAAIALPSGMDREAFEDMLQLETAELEILIPRPSILKRLLLSWSASRLHSWERMYASTVQEYNMLHNYDRTEEWIDASSRQGNEARTESGSMNNTASSTENGRDTSHGSTYDTNSQSVTTSKAAYNESALKAVEKADTSGNASRIQDGTASNERTTTDTQKGSSSVQASSNSSESANATRRGRAYGNIGVTTPFQMLEGERQLYSYDVYMDIINEFKRKFCVIVY